MSEWKCARCGTRWPNNHYADCPYRFSLALSPAVRLITPPVRDESVLAAFRGKEER